MKRDLQFREVMRSLLFGTAITFAACTFTACDTETNEPATAAVQEILPATTDNGAIIAGQYIVVFSQDGTLRMDGDATYAQQVDAVRSFGNNILADNGIQHAVIEQAYGKTITGIAVKLSATEAAKLGKDARVAYIEPDRVVTLGKPGSGTVTASSTQAVPWGITRVGRASGVGKTAWIIDTGIDLDHSDLTVNRTLSKTFITSGRDAKNADDNNGHGTHVAGTIAAKNNTFGVIGVAYGASVVAIKVLDGSGSGAYSGVIAGVDYVAAKAKSGDVANMSLGGPVSTALDNAILNAANKGIKFALAAGNESTDANYSSPARVNHVNVYTVSAMDSQDAFAYFSNYGNPPIDYCAPGVSIKSTWKGNTYNTISGTSMASPHVAGLLLLGTVNTNGFVKNDPDGQADPIAHR